MAWGDFAGAAVDGFSGGLAISDKLRAQKEALRQEAVKRAAATYMSGGQLGAQPGPQPPMPGQSSAPPQQMSIPGAQPMPQAAPPPPAPMAGAAPGGPPPMTGGGGPPPPGMGAPPPGGPPPPGMGAPPPGPPTGAGGTPMSATAAPQPQQPGQDPLQQQSSQTLASIAEGIKKANPGIDMLDLFDATEATIGQMKGVSDALKNQMVYDTNTAKLVFGMQELMAKIQSNDRNVDVKALAQQITAQTRADAAEDVAGTNAGARVESAKIGGKSRTDAASITGKAHIAGAAAWCR
jgi:hypothetical protein